MCACSLLMESDSKLHTFDTEMLYMYFKQEG